MHGRISSLPRLLFSGSPTTWRAPAWRASLAIVAVGLVGVSLAACDDPIEEDVDVEPPPPGFVVSTPVTTRTLTDVAVLGADVDGITLAYAVGTDGVITRFNGTGWAKENSGTDFDLEGVSGFVDGEGVETVMAVGAGGTVLSRVNGVWTALPSGTERLLFSVWVRRDDDAFVVGDRGTVLRYDGTALTALTDELLIDTGTVDDAGNAIEFAISDPLKSVMGRGADEVYAVGPRGVVYRYDGTRFLREVSETNRPLVDVFTRGGIFAATTDGVLLRRRGEGWNDTDFITPIPIFLQGVWARGDGDVFAVGLGRDVFHRTDGVWTGTDVGEGVELRAIDGVELPLAEDAPEDAVAQREIMAVGAGGRIVRGPLVEPVDGESRLKTREFPED